jgi:hypothetical protein
MVFYWEVIGGILDSLDKIEGHTLPFSVLLNTSDLSRRELLYFFDDLEQRGMVTHTTNFWGDPQSYTLLISVEDIKYNYTIC